MRLSNTQAVARPVYYDRNPVGKTQIYSASAVAPHGVTQRWSYTVPAGKKAFIDHSRASVVRAAAAAPVSTFNAFIQYTPNGGSSGDIIGAFSADNTVNGITKETATQVGAMLAGDILNGQTFDLSTGGTVNYSVDAKIFEYDG